jgi:hypothetical protein
MSKCCMLNVFKLSVFMLDVVLMRFLYAESNCAKYGNASLIMLSSNMLEDMGPLYLQEIQQITKKLSIDF